MKVTVIDESIDAIQVLQHGLYFGAIVAGLAFVGKKAGSKLIDDPSSNVENFGKFVLVSAGASAIELWAIRMWSKKNKGELPFSG